MSQLFDDFCGGRLAQGAHPALIALSNVGKTDAERREHRSQSRDDGALDACRLGDIGDEKGAGTTESRQRRIGVNPGVTGQAFSHLLTPGFLRRFQRCIEIDAERDGNVFFDSGFGAGAIQFHRTAKIADRIDQTGE